MSILFSKKDTSSFTYSVNFCQWDFFSEAEPSGKMTGNDRTRLAKPHWGYNVRKRLKISLIVRLFITEILKNVNPFPKMKGNETCQ
jgi:hypothetical protein